MLTGGNSKAWGKINLEEEISCSFLDVKSQKPNFAFDHWNLSKGLGGKKPLEITHT